MEKSETIKIAIPLRNNLIDGKAQLAPSFYHTSLLGIYDQETSILETIDLDQEDCALSFDELLKEYQIKAVISPVYTVMVLKLFKTMEIATFRASKNDAAHNLELFKNGELPLYTFQDAKEASKENCDSSSCGSCHSSC